RERPPLLACYYAYFGGLPMKGRFETYVRSRRGAAAAPTHDGRTLVLVGWPYADFEENKKDVEGNFWKALELAPAFEQRVRAAERDSRFAGAAVPNFFRRPYGPGWALVGDAGYVKDPITAQGIVDAFHDAERCASALGEWLRSDRSFEDALSDFHRARDAQALP